jgi:4-carboxymuconolactone decarboxylase
LARMEFPPLSDMSPPERLAYEEAAAGPRGHAPAPMAAWIRNPEFARRAQKLGEFIRFEIDLPGRLRELAVLVVARHWSAHHEWRVHEREALKQGLSADAVAQIADRRRPALESEAERVVYDITISILDTRAVPDALYRAGVAALGEQGLVELVGVIGYYTLVSMTLTAFEIGVPDPLQPELPEQEKRDRS